jgi:general secretion pathway protein I
MSSMAPDRGFTLIEVLVAFVIAAAALGALYHGVADSLAATGASGRYDEALSRARSHLATVGRGIPLRAASQRGEEGHDFRWEMVITPIATAPSRPLDENGNLAPPVTLYSVQVTEAWGDSNGARQVRLSTRRIGSGQL